MIYIQFEMGGNQAMKQKVPRF